MVKKIKKIRYSDGEKEPAQVGRRYLLGDALPALPLLPRRAHRLDARMQGNLGEHLQILDD